MIDDDKTLFKTFLAAANEPVFLFAMRSPKIYKALFTQMPEIKTIPTASPNVSGVKDYSNLALTEAIPSGWEIFNDRLTGGESAGTDYTYRDIRDDKVVWFFDLPKGTAKTFRVKMHAAYEGEFILPAVKCEAMYDSKVSANTASGTARVTK